MEDRTSGTRAVVLVAAALALAGCTSASSSSTARGSTVGLSPPSSGASVSVPASGPVVFTGSVAITGTVTADGPWTDSTEPWAGDCTNWAATSRVASESFDVPSPGGRQGAIVSGAPINVTFVFAHYRGPGTYTSGANTTAVDAGGPHFAAPASYALEVHADGSGSLRFRGLSDPHDPSKTVSGIEAWTCSS